MRNLENKQRDSSTLPPGGAVRSLRAADACPGIFNGQALPSSITTPERSPRRVLTRVSDFDQDRGTETMQLILNKISLPDEAPRVSRPRLLNTLHASLSACTSTVINGRAGTGKTTLAADFARRCGRRIAWYKVDASDADLRVFFQYLIESVRRQRPGFGHEALVPLVETATIEDMPVLAEAFVFELLESKGNGEPLLIVIDDLHLVYDAEWVVPFFRRLLPLLPAEAHMLITGRSMPPAPLWRMRSKQMLCVIEEPTLAFTQQEAVKLFESLGLAEAHATAALKHSRGRAVIIDRFAVVLSSSGKAVADGFIATERRLRKQRVSQLHGYSY
ncbi:MAG TPA: AAA family ATPase [Pyrinomonadaceae bacterium]|nr:AAA family ATPase [Pyrinomonadaceae bacterium]